MGYVIRKVDSYICLSEPRRSPKQAFWRSSVANLEGIRDDARHKSGKDMAEGVGTESVPQTPLVTRRICYRRQVHEAIPVFRLTVSDARPPDAVRERHTVRDCHTAGFWRLEVAEGRLPEAQPAGPRANTRP